MVESYVWRYCTSNSVEKTDLFQECMGKIFSSIGGYKQSKGKFTTWSSYVCFSVLNREYQKRIRWESHVVHDVVLDNRPDENPSNGNRILAQDVRSSIRDLMTRYPGNRSLILAIFGNPDAENYCPPERLKISSAARAAGMASDRAKVFFRDIIKPFFEKRFLQTETTEGTEVAI